MWRSDVTSWDILTSRFTSRPPAIRHIHDKNLNTNIFFKHTSKFSFGSTKAQWDEGGRIILLGNNTGGIVIILWSVRFLHGGVQKSTGRPQVNIYTWLHAHTILTREKYDLHQNFRNVTTTLVGKCLYTYTLHSLHKTSFIVCFDFRFLLRSRWNLHSSGL